MYDGVAGADHEVLAAADTEVELVLPAAARGPNQRLLALGSAQAANTRAGGAS